VVVVDGETELEPEATGVTEPTPLLILKDVAFAVVHERTEEAPVVIDVGEADSAHVGTEGGGGGGGGTGAEVTVMDAEHVTEPPSPVAVPM